MRALKRQLKELQTVKSVVFNRRPREVRYPFLRVTLKRGSSFEKINNVAASLNLQVVSREQGGRQGVSIMPSGVAFTFDPLYRCIMVDIGKQALERRPVFEVVAAQQRVPETWRSDVVAFFRRLHIE